MKFGTRKADAPEQSGNYLRNPAKGETLVRYLEEVDDWLLFYEHYNPDGRSFPCTEDRATCPGCTHPNEKVSERKRKYAVQCWLPKKDVVLPYRMPVTVVDRMTVRSERNGGTILNRDYVVIKSGSGFDTEYDVDQEDKYPVDIADLKKKIKVDIQDALNDSFAENAPEGAQTPVRSRKDDAGDPPSEPQRQQDSDAEEELTEAQVRAMDKAALLELCQRAGVKVDEEDTKSEIADKLIAAYGE